MADSRSVSSERGHSSSSSSYMSMANKPADRLKNKKTLTFSLLPSFIQAPSEFPKKVERQFSYKPSSPEENSPTFNHVSASFYNLKGERDKAKPEVKRQLEFSGSEIGDRSSISDTETFFEALSRRNKQEKVLKYWNLYLTGEEIESLKNGGEISRNLIDYCLSIFQKMNKDLLRKDSEIMKVLIASTSFSWKIFNQHRFEDLHFNDFVNAYQVIFFPIFIGYWTLLVVWNDEKRVYFHDIGGEGKNYIKDILITCYKFLHQEFINHNKAELIMKELNPMTYEHKKDYSDFPENLSALYILMIIKNYCIELNNQNYNISEHISEITADQVRSSLIDLILKESEDLHSLIPKLFQSL